LINELGQQLHLSRKSGCPSSNPEKMGKRKSLTDVIIRL